MSLTETLLMTSEKVSPIVFSNLAPPESSLLLTFAAEADP